MTYKIAIASGKGGTGKTTVAVNLFSTLLNAGKPVTLIDTDVEEPNANIFIKGEKVDEKPVNMMIPKINTDVCTFCGKCVDACAFSAIMMVKSVEHIQVLPDMCHSCGACSYVCPEEGAITEYPRKLGDITQFRMNSGKGAITYEGRMQVGEALAVPVIKDAKKKIIPDFINLIDAPPGTSCPAMEALHDVDYAILVAEPTPFGLNDLKIILSTVRRLNRRVGVVINKADAGNAELKDYLEQENVDVLASIPFSKAIAASYAEGRSIIDDFPDVKNHFEELWRKIELKLKETDATDNNS